MHSKKLRREGAHETRFPPPETGLTDIIIAGGNFRRSGSCRHRSPPTLPAPSPPIYCTCTYFPL